MLVNSCLPFPLRPSLRFKVRRRPRLSFYCVSSPCAITRHRTSRSFWRPPSDDIGKLGKTSADAIYLNGSACVILTRLSFDQLPYLVSRSTRAGHVSHMKDALSSISDLSHENVFVRLIRKWDMYISYILI